MVLRHHVTDVVELHTVVRSYFENSGFVPIVFDDGTSCTAKLGGDGKLAHFRCPTSEFTAIRNPKLQALLDIIARRCYGSYSTIDTGRMHDVYGLPQPAPNGRQETSRSSPPPVQSLDLSWVTSSGLRSPSPAVSPYATPTPAADPDEDPCDISGFLADPLELIRTFLSYIASTSSRADQEVDVRSKAVDEFKRRDCERPYWMEPLVPCVQTPNRLVSLNELSTSSEHSSDGDSADEYDDGLGSGP